MKKLFITLFSLIIIYIALKVLFFDNNSKIINYKIDDFLVTEEKVNEKNGYFVYKVKINDFSLQIFKDYKQSKIIKEIKHINDDNISCILPIFIDDKANTDLICKKDNYFYNYSVLKTDKIDEFYASLEPYFDNKEAKLESNIYFDNILNNHYLTLTTYKGFANINPKTRKVNIIDIYKTDVYDNYLTAFVDEYYVTVNYDERYGFSKIITYNTINLKKNEIIMPVNLEKNSYIQGIYDNTLYIFDRDNKKQYALSPSKNIWLEVGNVNIGAKVYKNGNASSVSAYECARNDILFENNEKFLNYILISKTKGTKTGYKYLYKKVDDYYQIYRSNNDDDFIIHLFNTTNINKINIQDEGIYYVVDDKIFYYSDITRSIPILVNNELLFNSKIKYQVFNSK